MSSTYKWTLNWAEQAGKKVFHKAELASTNDAAKDSEDFDLYITNYQTAGRGRGENSWQSEPGSGLLSTWSLIASNAPQHIASPLVGLAAYNAAQKIWPDLEWGIKPPNDLFLSDKKVGGLLIETLSTGHSHRILVGFGLNTHSHPKQEAGATDIESHLGHPLSEMEWHGLLDSFNTNLSLAIDHSTKTTLSRESCSDMDKALRGVSHQSYTHIDADGNLYAGDEKTAWQDLLD